MEGEGPAGPIEVPFLGVPGGREAPQELIHTHIHTPIHIHIYTYIHGSMALYVAICIYEGVQLHIMPPFFFPAFFQIRLHV